MSTVVAAIDCGATSVRVCRVDLDEPVLTPEVVHRVAHKPVRDPAGSLRWDWDRIVAAVIKGLERCLARGPLASIGVDTWAVDYGLLDDNDDLIAAPYSYRDHRTDGYRSIVDQFGAAAMYEINGLQLQPFNTIFQLAAHHRGELERAERLLWLPELIVHHLSGVATTERTSAGSSGLVDLSTGDWSTALVELAGVDPRLLGDIEGAGRVVGAWRGVPVSLVAGHDTASAVVGMGSTSPGGSAFVSSGTWMLVGTERSSPDTTDWARTRNFTNEAGALGGVRFLRNVTGFWILEQCRAHWPDLAIEDLVAGAERVAVEVPVVDVDHETLRNPDNMLTAYTSLAGLAPDTDPGLVTRSIVSSVAQETADVIVELGTVSDFDDIVLFGGAARMEFLVSEIGRRAGQAVRVGSAEAAALGNAIVQGIALGAFTTIDDGRARINATTTNAGGA